MQPIENKAQSNFGLSENKVQLKFELSENINGLKNQPVKNGAQVIENKAQSNFTFNGFFIETTYWKNYRS